MSAKSLRSVITDVPSGKNAVEKLRFLADLMKSPDIGFSKNEVKSVDEVIDSLLELEAECNRLREKVETETIKSSVLRHRLQNLPDDIKKQLQDVVGGARLMDIEEINNMKTQAEEMNNEIQKLLKERTRLEKENTQLIIHRDKERTRFNDLVLQLNEGMANKAGKQIILNETRDTLRLTNQKTVDLETAMIQLQEDLIEDRAQSKLDKKQLRLDLQEARQKLKQQEEISAVKKKELDAINAKVESSDVKLNELTNDIKHHETTVAMLNQHLGRLSGELEKKRDYNANLQHEIDMINKELGELEKVRSKRQTLFNGQLKKMKNQIEQQINRTEELKKQKAVLEEEMKMKLKIRKDDEVKVTSLSEQLQLMKKKVAEKAGELASLGNERGEMERRLQELDETHEAITTSLQKQIADCREVLAKDRGERQELQEHRDQQQRELEGMKTLNIDTTRDLTTKATDGKAKHDEMTRNAMALQQKLKEMDKEEASLKNQNANLQVEYDKVKQKLETEIQRLQNEIEQMKNEIAVKTLQLEERTPIFQELEANYVEKTDSYDKLKKHVVDLKTKTHALENSIKATQLDIEAATRPMPQLQEERDRLSADAVSQLRRYGEEMQKMENVIYTTGCKLKAVLKENDRFINANTTLEEELNNIDIKTKATDSEMEQYLQEIEKQKAILDQLWEKARMVEQKVAEKNRNFASQFGELMNKSVKRENIVGRITTNLGTELSQLAEFLEKVEKRRPKGSASQAPNVRNIEN